MASFGFGFGPGRVSCNFFCCANLMIVPEVSLLHTSAREVWSFLEAASKLNLYQFEGGGTMSWVLWVSGVMEFQALRWVEWVMVICLASWIEVVICSCGLSYSWITRFDHKALKQIR